MVAGKAVSDVEALLELAVISNARVLIMEAVYRKVSSSPKAPLCAHSSCCLHATTSRLSTSHTKVRVM